MKFRTKMMLLISVGLMAGMTGNAQTIINGGEVSGKWTKAESPYQVNGNITVTQGTTLEIEPGVTVEFWGYTGLTINGQLLAEGTQSDSIVFTRQSDYPYWGGLTFSAQGESESVVKYASIKNVSSNGVVIITAGTVTLSNNTISNNTGSGVYISSGTVTISNNTISNNAGYYVGGVYIATGNITLSDNEISNNTASANYNYSYGGGGGIYIADGIITMEGNNILNNTSNYWGFYAAKGTISLTNNTIDDLNMSNVELKALQGNKFTKTVSFANSILSGNINNCTFNSIALSNNTGKLEISNNTISGNTSSQGISISNSTADIIGNDISNNNGGVSITNSSVVTMRDNTVKNNVFTNSYTGGGIYMDKSTVNMYNNVVSGNSAMQAGGGIYVSNMIANILNNVITNNKHAVSKSGNGGGISLSNSSSMIINNTIAYNDAENGGGMYCAAGSSPVVIDNILYGNTSSLESQVYINDNNSAPKMLYNLNQTNTLGYAAGVNYNWDANYDASNFDANPQFVNYALQNYRLKDTSPCINAGIEDVTGLNLPDTDIDGNTRIYDGRIDIGAYEYGTPKTETGIKNTTVQQHLAIYPNPSRDGIFQLATDNNEVNWTVYDMKGAQISQGNTPLVDLSFCQKGIYIIKVQTGKDRITAKLVKL